VMDNIIWFHNFLLWLVTIITLFVLGLLIAVVVKFNARVEPGPLQDHSQHLIEVAWTLVPVLILVAIGCRRSGCCFRSSTFQADLTIKATGKQCIGATPNPDNGKFEFDSLLAQDKKPRLLGVR